MEREFQLRRCLFCNGWNLTLDTTAEIYAVRCLDCDASGPSASSKTRATAYWNGTHAEQNDSALVCCPEIRGICNRNDTKTFTL